MACVQGTSKGPVHVALYGRGRHVVRTRSVTVYTSSQTPVSWPACGLCTHCVVLPVPNRGAAVSHPFTRTRLLCRDNTPLVMHLAANAANVCQMSSVATHVAQ